MRDFIIMKLYMVTVGSVINPYTPLGHYRGFYGRPRHATIMALFKCRAYFMPPSLFMFEASVYISRPVIGPLFSRWWMPGQSRMSFHKDIVYVVVWLGTGLW